jgi:hypothetical protein
VNGADFFRDTEPYQSILFQGMDRCKALNLFISTSEYSLVNAECYKTESVKTCIVML